MPEITMEQLKAAAEEYTEEVAVEPTPDGGDDRGNEAVDAVTARTGVDPDDLDRVAARQAIMNRDYTVREAGVHAMGIIVGFNVAMRVVGPAADADRQPLSRRQLMDAIGRMDKRSHRIHEHDSLVPDEVNAVDANHDTVAADLGLSSKQLRLLLDTAEERMSDAMRRGNTVAEAIHSTLVHGLMLGQETERVRNDNSEED